MHDDSKLTEIAKKIKKLLALSESANAFAILGKVSKALKRAGHKELAEAYIKEAMSGDYDHLLQTTMDYVEVN